MVPFKPFVRPGLLCRAVVAAHVLPAGNQHAGAVGVCSSSAQCKDDEASDKTDWRHEHDDTPKLKSVPEWFEEKMLKNYTKFQAQTARANFCSFPIENVKDAQIETNSKVKLSKNMWLQTSD